MKNFILATLGMIAGFIVIVIGSYMALTIYNMDKSSDDNAQPSAFVTNTTSNEQPENTSQSDTQQPNQNSSTIPPRTENAAPASESSPYSTKIAKFSIYNDITGSLHFTGIVEVRNTGNNALYLGSSRFDIEDGTGHLINTYGLIYSCPDIISPGETGYFYTSGEITSESTTGYVLVPDLSIEKSYETPVDYIVSDASIIINDDGRATITGRVENNTLDDGLLYVEAILYNSNGDVLDISGTNVVDFSPGKRTGFEIVFYGTLDYSKPDINDYKVIARKMSYQF